jgi:hypothetical protein
MRGDGRNTPPPEADIMDRFSSGYRRDGIDSRQKGRSSTAGGRVLIGYVELPDIHPGIRRVDRVLIELAPVHQGT